MLAACVEILSSVNLATLPHQGTKVAPQDWTVSFKSGLL